MPIEIKVVKLHPDAVIPRYSHEGAFGDLAADLSVAVGATIAPGEIKLLRTGLAMEFPAEYGALVEDRSGLATKGITTLGGVIDPGYRGEISIVLANVGDQPVTVKAGERIAQLRIVQRIEARFTEAAEVSSTARGARGFGSTGV